VTNLKNLRLPKRFENLQQAAEDFQADLTQIVRKVPDATARVEQLIRQVSGSEMGRFEMVLGPSGSGKTTFLSTLQRFYSGAHVTPLPDSLALDEIVPEIQRLVSTPIDGQIFVLLDRDNPELDPDSVRRFFEALRRLFRTRQGRILILWPITDENSANALASSAWNVGSDSIVDASLRGVFHFRGIPKEQYFDVADITARSLNSGQGLEAFGLGKAVIAPDLQESNTLSQFFGRLEARSQELNNQFGDTLKERKVPSIWILVGGDDTRELSLTTATLTQGTEKRVDIDRMIDVLDSGDSTTGYLGDWRARRDQIAFLLRHLDVRIFELTPNVAVSAIRAYGDPAIQTALKKKTDSATNAIRAMGSARFFQYLSNESGSNAATIRAASPDTADEYRRIQKLAAKDDKLLNKALAACLSQALDDAGISASVIPERRSLDAKSSLKPDLLVEMTDGRVVCLEPTWRTTGCGIEGEIPAQQSTMSVGHIQQYLLAKVLEYVKDMGL